MDGSSTASFLDPCGVPSMWDGIMRTGAAERPFYGSRLHEESRRGFQINTGCPRNEHDPQEKPGRAGSAHANTKFTIPSPQKVITLKARWLGWICWQWQLSKQNRWVLMDPLRFGPLLSLSNTQFHWQCSTFPQTLTFCPAERQTAARTWLTCERSKQPLQGQIALCIWL